MPLPPMRPHGLRHGAATMLIAAGVDDKFVSEVLGHASVSFTKDVYAVVAEELATDATRRIAAFNPRQSRLSAVGAGTVPSGGCSWRWKRHREPVPRGTNSLVDERRRRDLNPRWTVKPKPH